jgi:hypothetical protein
VGRMKILDVYEVEDMIVYHTDHKSRPDFVYSKDKFNNLKEAETEILRSIAFEEILYSKKTKKFLQIKTDMEALKNA